MVQNYMEFRQSKGLMLTIKPNVSKIFLKNLLGISGIVLLVIGILWFVNLQVGLGIFLDVLEIFGFIIEPSEVLFYSILAVLAVSGLLLLGNYMANSSLRYDFYQNKMVSHLSSLLVLKTSQELSYENITRIMFNNSGLFNSIFNSGTVVLETSGMGSEKTELRFIDDVEQAVQSIQNALQDFKSIKQAQFTENFKIEGIMNRYE